MNRLRRYITTFGIWAAVWVFAFADQVPLFAKRTARQRVLKPPEIEGGVPWLAAVYAVIALLGICVVAFKDPKRTHLD